MNGIDRATTVEFSNSYVLLTNENDNGDLEGIQSIVNLIIPDGTGLKISADGEISGDFTGGGELYLDSEVCLTIGGNVTGSTVLTLNPEVNIIKGGEDFPYVKVGGTYSENAFYSNDSRYDIINSAISSYQCYYIYEDVVISNYVDVVSTSAEGRIYDEEITSTSDITILNNGMFSTELVLDYSFVEEDLDDTSYENVAREFTIKDESSNIVEIPAGTEIVMINDGVYYTYIVQANTASIPLSVFTDINGNKYSEITNIKDVATGVQNPTVANYINYSYEENFRFIINFANANEMVETGRYYPMININDNAASIGSEQQEDAENVVIVQDREYSYEYTIDNDKYKKDGVITIDGTLNISDATGVTEKANQSLYVIIKLLNSNGDVVRIPIGTVVKINDVEQDITSNFVKGKIIETITNSSTSENLDITIDMSDVISQYGLSEGEYTVDLSFVHATGEVLENCIQVTAEIDFGIVDYENVSYGIKTEIQAQNELDSDKLQLIECGESTGRTITLTCDNEKIQNAYVNISVLKRTDSFTYEEVKRTGITVSSDTISNILSSQDVSVDFADNVDTGTYRILFELYDEYGYKLTESYESFIVI